VKKNQNSNYFVLQFVSIKRIDTGDWAIPGVKKQKKLNLIKRDLYFCMFTKGMCDPGEKVSQTLKREFMEEATDCLGSNESERQRIEEHLREFFENGQEVINIIININLKKIKDYMLKKKKDL
jgi:ADP-ribose pyrophosphatase